MQMNGITLQLKGLKFEKVRNALCIIILGLSVISCAFGTDRVKLHDPLTYAREQKGMTSTAIAAPMDSKPAQGDLIQMALERVRDNRSDISRIGAKKNAYGMHTGNIDVEEGVVFLDLFTKNLIKCFESAGYKVIPTKEYETISPVDREKVKAHIETEVRNFWVEFMPGLFVVDAVSNVIFEVRLHDPTTNREIWSETFRGKGKVSGVAVTRGMFEESINIAYSEAMRQFRSTLAEEKTRGMFKQTLRNP
jgi:hypothetical protein